MWIDLTHASMALWKLPVQNNLLFLTLTMDCTSYYLGNKEYNGKTCWKTILTPACDLTRETWYPVTTLDKCIPTKAFFLSSSFHAKIKQCFVFNLITIYVLDLLCRLRGLTEFATVSFLTGLMFIHGMNADRGVYKPPLAACWCLDLCAKAPPVLSFNDSFQSLTVSGKEKKGLFAL